MIHPSVLPLDTDRARRVVRAVAAPSPDHQHLDGELLQDIAEGLALSVTALQLPSGSARRWVRVLATHSYDAWLIGWPPGSGRDLHDHGESGAAICIVTGELEEHHLAHRGSTQLVRRRLAAGDAVTFDSSHVHAVHNASDRDATSVHVYSPPLSTMTFFEQAAGSGLVPVDAALFENDRTRSPLSIVGA